MKLKAIAIASIVLFSQPLWAGCEATYMDGGHTALTTEEARQGAWEEAKDACYPGDAQRSELNCVEVEGEIGVEGEPAVRCFQEVTCTLCGEALERKYDARQRD